MDEILKLFQKEGAFSKTATILVFTWAIALFKWIFQDMVLSLPFLGITWKIVFASGDAIAMTGAASALYFAVHNVTRYRSE